MYSGYNSDYKKSYPTANARPVYIPLPIPTSNWHYQQNVATHIIPVEDQPPMGHGQFITPQTAATATIANRTHYYVQHYMQQPRKVVTATEVECEALPSLLDTEVECAYVANARDEKSQTKLPFNKMQRFGDMNDEERGGRNLSDHWSASELQQVLLPPLKTTFSADLRSHESKIDQAHLTFERNNEMLKANFNKIPNQLVDSKLPLEQINKEKVKRLSVAEMNDFLSSSAAAFRKMQSDSEKEATYMPRLTEDSKTEKPDLSSLAVKVDILKKDFPNCTLFSPTHPLTGSNQAWTPSEKQSIKKLEVDHEKLQIRDGILRVPASRQ